jgi:glycine/D-amino acid oxidase-like deaminating enzyme/nitrite reductase/ring-hydroxylating ferredoxin subunit
MVSRDGSHISLWQDTIVDGIKTSTSSAQKADVIIVGAGITGISTALMLQKAGKRCTILEAHNIGFGTTGGTTAHINTLLDTPYTTLIKKFNLEDANLVARAAEDAVSCIRDNVEKYEIDCGFENCKGFLFAQDEKQDKELESIMKACRDVELPVAEEAAIPVPVGFTRAASVAGQAKFHPLQYIEGLVKDFIYLGGVIIENCRVTHVEEQEEILHVKTDTRTFQCDKLIYATHVPPGINLIHLRYTALRSYAIAVTLASGDYPKDLSYDMYDPYHYYRTQEIDGQSYLIVGGEDHKTGDDTNTDACFLKLESHVRKYFDVAEVTHRWSSQYYDSVDGLPYIGIMPGKSDRILVATGFGGNGMTYGTIAAKVLKSIVVGEDNPLIKLFSPSRIKPIAGFKNFAEHNVDVLKEVIGKLFSSEEITGLAELAPEEGKVIQLNNQKVGLYKDKSGAVHAINATCTHMGCTVGFNQTEKSWDCPCHGARFSVDGTVLNGPADRDLEYLNVELLEFKKP